MKKKKKHQPKHQPNYQLDCYAIKPNGIGKITFSYPYEESIMKELGDLGKW